MMIKGILLIILLFFTLSCSQNTHQVSRKPANTGIDASKYINMLPTQGLRDAAKEYATMIGLNHYQSTSLGGSNEGLVAFNWDLLQNNKCFRNLTASFYADVAKYTAFYSRNLKPRSDYLFNNLSKTTSNSSVKDGWLWELALQKANGDGNLAMSLIGICGHDDAVQLPNDLKCTNKINPHNDNVANSCNSNPKFIPFTDNTQRDNYMRDSVESYENFMKNWIPTSASGKVLKEKALNSLKKSLGGDMQKGMTCPLVASSMYTQGALGKETLLPKRLINQIATIQAPNKGAGVLPSKYYHTMGAAYATCSLVRKGFPGFMIKKMQSIAINTYRMFRVCDVVASGDYLKSASNVSEADFTKLVSEFRANPKTCITNHGSGESYMPIDPSKPGCLIIQRFKSVVEDPDVDITILLNKFRRVIEEVDAAILFNKQVLKGGKCNDVQLTGGNIERIQSVSESSSPCKSITADRCQKAKRRLKTWWIDFKWSEAQHLKGAEFAINNCKSESDFFESGLEKKSCEALKPANEQPAKIESEAVQ